MSNGQQQNKPKQTVQNHCKLDKHKESSSTNFVNYYQATCPDKNAFKNSCDEIVGKCDRF